MRLQLVRDMALLQAVASRSTRRWRRSRGRYGPRCGRNRKVTRPAAERRHHEILDAGADVLELVDELPRDQERQRCQALLSARATNAAEPCSPSQPGQLMLLRSMDLPYLRHRSKSVSVVSPKAETTAITRPPPFSQKRTSSTTVGRSSSVRKIELPNFNTLIPPSDTTPPWNLGVRRRSIRTGNSD